jgi:acetyltransferase-like isoleucine patch superfamily enzyme
MVRKIKNAFYELLHRLIEQAEEHRCKTIGRKMGFPASVSLYRATIIGHNISIGERTYLNEGCLLSGGVQSRLTIGADCAIGRYVHIAAKTHDLRRPTTGPEAPSLLEREADVQIGNCVWIGDKVYIGPGVTIGDHAIIGANSVVTKDIAPFEIVGGVPARHIRFNTENEKFESK